MYGVSPAYFISACGDGFTPIDVAVKLPGLSALGFDAYQLEVFHPETLRAWTDHGIDSVVAVGRDHGLEPSQFVGHFLLHAFGSEEAIRSELGIDDLSRVVEALVRIDCRIVTVAIPQLSGDGEADFAGLYNAFAEKIARMESIVGGAGFTMALEILPGAIIGGSDGFLRLCRTIGSESLAYNFDTGHAWAQKEPVSLIPSKLRGRITGTHICDNDGGVNLSLPPGDGTIPWESTLGALARSGYRGSIDIEVKCNPEEVEGHYRRSLDYVRQVEERLVAKS